MNSAYGIKGPTQYFNETETQSQYNLNCSQGYVNGYKVGCKAVPVKINGKVCDMNIIKRLT
jgi:hypothetical protein